MVNDFKKRLAVESMGLRLFKKFWREAMKKGSHQAAFMLWKAKYLDEDDGDPAEARSLHLYRKWLESHSLIRP